MQNKGKSVIGIAASALLISLASLLIPKEKPFTHVDYMPQSAVHVVIASGHNSILDGIYLTQGKQSPTWSDSLKIYEGFSCKLLALDLCQKLMLAGIDVTYLNNYNTEMSLFERANKVNSMCNLDNRILFIEIHHNAQIAKGGDYTDFEGLKGFTSISSGGASGIEVYTSSGQTESDNFADNYLMPNLKGYLPDLKFRNNGKCKEAAFYVLVNTVCTSVLIEFNFMTTYPDCKQIADPLVRNNFTQAIVNSIVNYNSFKKIKQ